MQMANSNNIEFARLNSTLTAWYSRDSLLFSTLLIVSDELEVIQDQLAGVNGIADLQRLYRVQPLFYLANPLSLS